MRFWKAATLLALATIPFLFINTSPRKRSTPPVAADDDNIFAQELTAD